MKNIFKIVFRIDLNGINKRTNEKAQVWKKTIQHVFFMYTKSIKNSSFSECNEVQPQRNILTYLEHI